MIRFSSVVLVLVGGVCVPACGETTPSALPAAAAAASARTPVERYFPLEEGRIYHYVTQENGERGMLVAKVHRSDATHAELRLSNGTKRFSYVPDGVRYDGGAFLLKTPLEVGATWPGEHGGTTRVVSTDANVTVSAGTYASCVRTIEDGGRIPGATYTTTYCPAVGMVLLEIEAGGASARAELKSYGAPFKIE